jgi:hypothetical protein
MELGDGPSDGLDWIMSHPLFMLILLQPLDSAAYISEPVPLPTVTAFIG